MLNNANEISTNLNNDLMSFNRPQNAVPWSKNVNKTSVKLELD